MPITAASQHRQERSDAHKASSLPNGRVEKGSRFNPYRLFHGIFIPEQILRYPRLSLGAKMTYGLLGRYAGSDGHAYPSIKTLAVEMGKGETQARGYINELKLHKFIESERSCTQDGRQTSNFYFFVWHAVFDAEIVSERRARNPEATPPRDSEPKKNHHQQSQMEERNQYRPKQPVSADSVLPPNPREKKLDMLKRADDDENEPALKAPLPIPKEEFLRRLKERHGEKFDAEETARLVLFDLNNHGLTLDQYLAFDELKTTGKLLNPGGYYRDLVKKLSNKHRAQALEETLLSTKLLQIGPISQERCAKCRGVGRILDSPGYCDCRLGIDLKRADQRIALDKAAQIPLPPTTQRRMVA